MDRQTDREQYAGGSDESSFRPTCTVGVLLTGLRGSEEGEEHIWGGIPTIWRRCGLEEVWSFTAL